MSYDLKSIVPRQRLTQVVRLFFALQLSVIQPMSSQNSCSSRWLGGSVRPSQLCRVPALMPGVSLSIFEKIVRRVVASLLAEAVAVVDWGRADLAESTAKDLSRRSGVQLSVWIAMTLLVAQYFWA